ncbi:MAG: methyltransferase domain-containing protein [Terriglobia bacterium]
MTPEENQFLYELEERHWWFQGMRRILAGLLNRHVPSPVRVLDAGCGTGFMLSWLRRRVGNAKVLGLDFSANALSYCQARGERLLVQGSIGDLPFRSDCFDLILTLDVLDSFPRQEASRPFAELARVLRKGGTILVRVPAFQFLYSQHDRAVSTVHRYTAHELADCLKREGLTLGRVTYANTFLFPLAALWRRLRRSQAGKCQSDVKPLPRGLRWLNPLLAGILGIEAWWLKCLPWRLPVGLSVIALASKPKAQPPSS